jgi:hypothetical protein
MMATAVINNLRALGCELTADGSTLHVRPGALLTAELREQIKAHKPEMLALLTIHCPTCNLSLEVRERGGWITAQCEVVTLSIRSSEGATARLALYFGYGHAAPCQTCGRGGITHAGICLPCLNALKEAKAQATKRFITAGYAGLDFAEFKQAVTDLKAVVIDIRFNPTSKLLEWTKSHLEHELGANYRHVGALGNKNFADQTMPIEIADMRLGIEVLLRQTPPVILLCGCASRLRCHRRLISNELERLGYWTEELSL